MSVVVPDGTPITDTDRTVVRAISHTGGDYRVDVRDGRCDCPDATHRNATCKHQRRARIALGRQSVATDTLAAVDVDTTLEANAPDPRVATTDGGLIGAGDDAEILSDTDNPPGRLRLLGRRHRAPVLAVLPGRVRRPEPSPRESHNAAAPPRIETTSWSEADLGVDQKQAP